MTATDSTHRAFLNAVLHDPADDAPRLILADWLDEHGQEERGELIRVQCELARIAAPCACDGCIYPDVGPMLSCKCTRCKLGNRSRELLAAHGERWAMEELVRPLGFNGILPQLTSNHWSLIKTIDYGGNQGPHHISLLWHWSRGFISRVECTTETLMGRACDNCDGTGKDAGLPDEDWYHCPPCGGTGRIPVAAAALARAVPLEECVLTDKRLVHPSGTSMIVCQNGDSTIVSYQVPVKIFECLELMPDDFYTDNPTQYGQVVFDSESAAISALSKAAAKWVRKEAGLE